MENRAHALWAGAFALGLLVALAGVVYWLSAADRNPTVPYVLVSQTSVGGLNPQAPVRYRGVEIGSVERVHFDPESPQTILIDIAVSPRTPVTEATFARLGFMGVTGIAYVELDDEGKAGRPVSTSRAHPARLEMRPSMLKEFGDAGLLLLGRVNDIADRLNVLLNDENQRKLSNTLGSVERLAQRLVETQDRLAPTLDALPGLTERTRSLLAESEKLAKDLEAVSRDVRAHADAVDRAGRGIEQIGAAATDVSTQTLPHLNRVLARLEHTAENLDRAIEAQARDPGSLLFGAAPPEAGPGEPGFERRKGGGR